MGATGERERVLGLPMTVTLVVVKSEYQETKRENSVFWKRPGALIAVRIKIIIFQDMKKCRVVVRH
jgi:hypothetical protein